MLTHAKTSRLRRRRFECGKAVLCRHAWRAASLTPSAVTIRLATGHRKFVRSNGRTARRFSSTDSLPLRRLALHWQLRVADRELAAARLVVVDEP